MIWVSKQLTSLVCTITRADGTGDWSNNTCLPSRSPPCPSLLRCVEQGHAWTIMDSMLLGDFQVTRRHSVHTTGPLWIANTDNVHVMVQDLCHMQQRPWQFSYRAGFIFSQLKVQNNTSSTPIFPSHLFLKQSMLYANIYRGL